MRLEEFLTVGDRLNGEAKAVHDEVARLKIRIEELHDSLKPAASALHLCCGLRRCYRPPAFFYEGTPRCFFVRGYSLDADGNLQELSGVIVPSIVWPNEWSKMVETGRPGRVTIEPDPLEGAEIARRTAELYAGDKVRIGAFDEICREPCTGCGQETFLVCTHDFDYEWGDQRIDLDRLCLHCLEVETIVRCLKHRVDQPNPFLPPNTP